MNRTKTTNKFTHPFHGRLLLHGERADGVDVRQSAVVKCGTKAVDNDVRHLFVWEASIHDRHTQLLGIDARDEREDFLCVCEHIGCVHTVRKVSETNEFCIEGERK